MRVYCMGGGRSMHGRGAAAWMGGDAPCVPSCTACISRSS
jgi:hypothetical protein